MSMTVWIVLFIVVDAIVVYFVLRRALDKLLKLQGGNFSIAGMPFNKIARFAKDVHEETGRYLQANYSGDPQHLPQAMQGLMKLARTRAEQEGLSLDPDVLRKLLETSALKHRVAKAAEIHSALERAA